MIGLLLQRPFEPRLSMKRRWRALGGHCGRSIDVQAPAMGFSASNVLTYVQKRVLPTSVALARNSAHYQAKQAPAIARSAHLGSAGQSLQHFFDAVLAQRAQLRGER